MKGDILFLSWRQSRVHSAPKHANPTSNATTRPIDEIQEMCRENGTFLNKSIPLAGALSPFVPSLIERQLPHLATMWPPLALATLQFTFFPLFLLSNCWKKEMALFVFFWAWINRRKWQTNLIKNTRPVQFQVCCSRSHPPVSFKMFHLFLSFIPFHFFLSLYIYTLPKAHVYRALPRR